MKITEVVTDSLGNVLNSFYICQACQIVDRDDGRIVKGHPCSNCGKPSPAGRSYFGLQVSSLIDLMQEFYHARYEKNFHSIGDHLGPAQNAQVAVVIFFVTLREVLLLHFVDWIMRANRLPDGVRERLLSDNSSHNMRIEKLIPSLVGMRWKAAVAELNKDAEIDYNNLDSFLKNVVRARNTFLHQGHKVAIQPQMAEDCMNNIWPLLSLHVGLHNRFVYAAFHSQQGGL